jgi:DNA-binding transcriptional ArsR family regulator
VTEVDLAGTARLIGDPARAAMLDALLATPALPAGELARAAGVAAATASEHLAKLRRA